jgi:hypothetical protein
MWRGKGDMVEEGRGNMLWVRTYSVHTGLGKSASENEESSKSLG